MTPNAKLIPASHKPCGRRLIIIEARANVALAMVAEPRGSLQTEEKLLARPKGLEPLTGGLETRCSIRLSYERVLRKL